MERLAAERRAFAIRIHDFISLRRKMKKIDVFSKLDVGVNGGFGWRLRGFKEGVF